jgi:transketolase N-terminal domain/subunit
VAPVIAAERCRRFRRRILDISQRVPALHIGAAFSCMEIVDAIYHDLMRRGADGGSPDTFLMSKGHGCLAQYVALESLGVLSPADLDAYCTPQAFGWEAVEVAGHDSAAIVRAAGARSGSAPFAAVARTTKGKGVSFMEGVPIWHYRSPSPAEYAQALAELEQPA